MNYAPIALFTYNRPDHTRQAVESLLLNAEAKDSDIFIFSDGPKTEAKIAGVEENRRYIHTITGFKSVTIIERERNWGLANSLIDGITDVIERFGRVIVVEDDLVLSPYFLKFMNDGLEKYENDGRVAAISGYVPLRSIELPETFFLHYFHCWGWATWKRGWSLLNTDCKFLLRQLRMKKNEFDVGGNADAYGNLYCQKVGLVDSWWVRLYASFFLEKKLTLYPGKSLVQNTGLDGTGTHCPKQTLVDSNQLDAVCPINVRDINVMECDIAYRLFKQEFDSRVGEKCVLFSAYYRLKSFIRRFFYIDCM